MDTGSGSGVDVEEVECRECGERLIDAANGVIHENFIPRSGTIQEPKVWCEECGADVDRPLVVLFDLVDVFSDE